MSSVEPLHLIYDGRCAFCVRALEIARFLDVFRVLRFHDSNDRDAVEAAFPMLRGADFDDAMYAVGAEGREYRGFFAFRRLARSCVLLWPFVPIFYFPGSSIFGPHIYAWIARNRTRFGCRWPLALPPAGGGAEAPQTERPCEHCDDPQQRPRSV